MVVICPASHEDGSGEVGLGDPKIEPTAEIPGHAQIGNLQMQMADVECSAASMLATSLQQDAIQGQCQADHLKLLTAPRPFAGGFVPREFHSIAIGVVMVWGAVLFGWVAASTSVATERHCHTKLAADNAILPAEIALAIRELSATFKP